MNRGSVWWAELPASVGSVPGYRRPVVIIQADSFNRSRVNSVIVAAITSNIRLANAPGNLLLSSRVGGLPRDSVVNVSQLITIDRSMLEEKITELSAETLYQLDNGLRLILAL